MKVLDRPTLHLVRDFARETIRSLAWLLFSFVISYAKDLLVETHRPPWMVAIAEIVAIFSFLAGAFVLCCVVGISALLSVLPLFRKLRQELKPRPKPPFTVVDK